MPPADIFSSSMRLITTRSCNGLMFMGVLFAEGLSRKVVAYQLLVAEARG
jgi:hypothetical protein